MKMILLTLCRISAVLCAAGKTPTPSPAEKEFIVSNIDETSDLSWTSDAHVISDAQEEAIDKTPPPVKVTIELKQVFKGSPLIYTLLLTLSMTSVALWLYTVLRWRRLGGYSESVVKKICDLIQAKKHNEARMVCQNKEDLFSKVAFAALSCKGREEMEETVRSVVKKGSSATWQRISILNDIAIIAPMLGLMGTVLGMFYAFYDINRSLDSLTKLFDGLGISVATTVAGLSVALLSLLFHTYLKHRLIRRLSVLEHETNTLLALIHTKET